MNSALKTFLFSLSFILGLTISAQTDRSGKPRSKPAPEIRIGKFHSILLKNGMKVYVVENHKLPVISYSFLIHHDPVFEGEFAGYRSITRQMLGTTTLTRNKDEIDRAIDQIGATLSVDEKGIYAITLRKHNERLLELLADMLVHAVFTNEEFEKVKQREIAALVAKMNDPDFIASRLMKSIVFGKQHPYGEIETALTLSSVTLDRCKEYYNQYIRPNHLRLAIVGDITPDEAEILINKYFGNWQPYSVPSKTYPMPQPPQKRQVIVVDRPDAVQSVIKICYPLDFRPGQEDYIATTLANIILGGSSNRLFLNLREKNGFTYGAYSQLHDDLLCGYFEAYTSVRNSVTDSAIHEILYEMGRINNESVKEYELQLAKNNLTGTFALSLESPETIARFAIQSDMYALPENYFVKYLENIEKTTAAEIMTAAQRTILPGRSYIIVVGRAEEILPVLQKFSMDGKILQYDIEGNLIPTH